MEKVKKIGVGVSNTGVMKKNLLENSPGSAGRMSDRREEIEPAFEGDTSDSHSWIASKRAARTAGPPCA